MSDVLLIDNSIQQDTVLVPVTAVQPDLVTQTDVVVYVPLASKTAHGIVKIGEGLHITQDGLLSFDRSEVTIKEIALNGTLLVPDENKRVNIVLHKKDVIGVLSAIGMDFAVNPQLLAPDLGVGDVLLRLRRCNTRGMSHRSDVINGGVVVDHDAVADLFTIRGIV